MLPHAPCTYTNWLKRDTRKRRKRFRVKRRCKGRKKEEGSVEVKSIKLEERENRRSSECKAGRMTSKEKVYIETIYPITRTS